MSRWWTRSSRSRATNRSIAWRSPSFIGRTSGLSRAEAKASAGPGDSAAGRRGRRGAFAFVYLARLGDHDEQVDDHHDHERDQGDQLEREAGRLAGEEPTARASPDLALNRLQE